MRPPSSNQTCPFTSHTLPPSLLTSPSQAETAAFEGEHLYPKGAYKDATLYTTLSPCWMCTGAALWFQVKRVVIGDSQSFTGPEDVLRREGVEVVVLNTRECVQLTEKFRARAPEQWEDEIAR